jgi:hypothetical protein
MDPDWGRSRRLRAAGTEKPEEKQRGKCSGVHRKPGITRHGGL